MNLDDFWEKYSGEEISQHTSNVVEPKVESVRQERPKQKTNEYKKENDPPKNEYAKKMDSGINKEQKHMPGLFGDETIVKDTSHGPKKERNTDLGTIRNWPWIDIIFGTITIAMIVGVIMNFETVTTAIFNALLPILCNIFILVIVVGLIVFLIWWFSQRRRRWW